MDNDELSERIDDLMSTQTQHLNRLLACEAAVVRMIPLLPLDHLQRLVDEFDEAYVQAMHSIPPEHQRQEPWENMRTAIEEARAQRAKDSPTSDE